MDRQFALDELRKQAIVSVTQSNVDGEVFHSEKNEFESVPDLVNVLTEAVRDISYSKRVDVVVVEVLWNGTADDEPGSLLHVEMNTDKKVLSYDILIEAEDGWIKDVLRDAVDRFKLYLASRYTLANQSRIALEEED